MTAVMLLMLMSGAAHPGWLPALLALQDTAAANHAITVKEISDSGRVLNLAPVLDDRIRIAPGAPPLLAFRYLEGRSKGRFGGLDLVLDDAGH